MRLWLWLWLGLWLVFHLHILAITEVAQLEFPFDTSQKWVSAGNIQTVSGNYEAWMSGSYLYQVKVNGLAGTFRLLRSTKIPTQFLPKIALITDVGVDGQWLEYLIITKSDPFTLKAVRVEADNTWRLVNSARIPGTSSGADPNWQLFLSEETSTNPSIIYIFGVDLVVAFDYPDWQFGQYVNTSKHVPDLYPMTRVYGAALSELDYQLYMARYGAGALRPGQLVLFTLEDLDGTFKFKTVTFLDSSPANFIARVQSSPTWIFWAQSFSNQGIVYRWTLQEGNFRNAPTDFLSGEKFGPALAKNQAESLIIYSSGPISAPSVGYRLSVLDPQEMSWVDSLSVNNDTVPQLAITDVDEVDNLAVFGTVTNANTMKLVLYQYGPSQTLYGPKTTIKN
jgi:hypothetical protein